MITTVVFDLDDTLYDEVDYCKSGFSAVAEFFVKYAGGQTARQIYDCLRKQFAAGNRTKTFNEALQELGIDYDDKLIGSAVEVYRSHTPKITLPQQSRDVLDRLVGKYTLALLTDGFLPAQQLKVKALGIEKYFKCIIYTEQLGRECWKPSTAGFEKVLAGLNAKAQNSAYVADNPKKDFIAPNKLRFATIQIIRPARIHTEPPPEPAAAPRHIINKISQLPGLLEKL